MRVVAAALIVVGSGCASKKTWFTDGFFSTWDDRRVLCSMGADATHSWPLSDLYDAVDRAADEGIVLHTYGHAAGLDLAEYLPVFQHAHDRGVDFVTYDELVDRSRPRAAWAFSIDDQAIDTWVTWRDTLRDANVRFTFFLSMWGDLTDVQLGELADLAGDGHAIEPHGMHHLDAGAYAGGPEGYVADEIVPELDGLVSAGYTPTTFAYPYGAHTAATDAAILEHVSIIRTATSHYCYAYEGE